MTTTERASESIASLETPEQCEIFERNATKQGRSDLAVAARKRALQLRATVYGTISEAERECLEAVYAYERVLTAKNKKPTRVGRVAKQKARHP
jgi:hypothetical protein